MDRYIYTDMHSHTCTYIYSYSSHSYTYTHTHNMSTHMYTTNASTHIHSYAHRHYKQIHTYTHLPTYIHINSQKHTHTHIYMHTCAHSHIHTYTCVDSKHMTTHIYGHSWEFPVPVCIGVLFYWVFSDLCSHDSTILPHPREGGHFLVCFIIFIYILLKWSKLKGLKLTIRAFSLKRWPWITDFSRGMQFGCSLSFGAICWTEAVWANQSWSAQNPPWVPGTNVSKLVSCWNKIGRGSMANLQFPVHILKLPLPISSEFHKTPSLDSLSQVSSQCRPSLLPQHPA